MLSEFERLVLFEPVKLQGLAIPEKFYKALGLNPNLAPWTVDAVQSTILHTSAKFGGNQQIHIKAIREQL
ncbi:hypothetical protein ACFSJY_04035 [Thalassotalea euphylliae]|uniref:hypothetical protein n=1 Tax=Thalassotalea euphylliae TaxID=1655234 RepID=UPI0036331953